MACPQNIKTIRNDLDKAKAIIRRGGPVYASIAPSFVANYPGATIASMRKALKELGFTDAQETAVGAEVIKTYYDKQIDEGKADVVISSCCHSINLLIQKHFPACLEHLADVMSPMQAHCLDIKKRYPGAKTVFVGPCVAKKDEADYYKGIVDAVLTFEELSEWMKEEKIELENETDSDEYSRARFFPTTGGILKTMEPNISGYTYMALDGIENSHFTFATSFVKNGDKEINYSFRMIGEKLNLGQAFGIEVERQDLIEGKVVQIERDIIERISTKE